MDVEKHQLDFVLPLFFFPNMQTYSLTYLRMCSSHSSIDSHTTHHYYTTIIIFTHKTEFFELLKQENFCTCTIVIIIFIGDSTPLCI